MKVGQKVKWDSQGGGNATIKVGTIKRVLKQGEVPWKVGQKEFPNHQKMFDGWNLPGGKKTKKANLIEVVVGLYARPRLYMPIPSKLVMI